MTRGAAGGSRFATARWLALIVPAALLAGAYSSEWLFGLYPCEMCWWQRWPHFAAVALAVVGLAHRVRLWPALAALAMASSGLIGGFHAGVEYGLWEGVTGCALAPVTAGTRAIDAIINAPMIRCDRAPWDLWGISLAGWNFIVSMIAAASVFYLLQESRHEES